MGVFCRWSQSQLQDSAHTPIPSQFICFPLSVADRPAYPARPLLSLVSPHRPSLVVTPAGRMHYGTASDFVADTLSNNSRPPPSQYLFPIRQFRHLPLNHLPSNPSLYPAQESAPSVWDIPQEVEGNYLKIILAGSPASRGDARWSSPASRLRQLVSMRGMESQAMSVSFGRVITMRMLTVDPTGKSLRRWHVYCIKRTALPERH